MAIQQMLIVVTHSIRYFDLLLLESLQDSTEWTMGVGVEQGATTSAEEEGTCGPHNKEIAEFVMGRKLSRMHFNLISDTRSSVKCYQIPASRFGAAHPRMMLDLDDGAARSKYYPGLAS